MVEEPRPEEAPGEAPPEGGRAAAGGGGPLPPGGGGRAGAGGRIVIAKIGVDAPLTYKPVVPDPNGGTTYPPNPDGADDVAYYDFSAYPGLGGGPGIGGNSVFANPSLKWIKPSLYCKCCISSTV